MAKSKTPENQGNEKPDESAQDGAGKEAVAALDIVESSEVLGVPLGVNAGQGDVQPSEQMPDNTGDSGADEAAGNEEREEGGEQHDEPPVKRGRGRPRKNPAATDEKDKQRARLRSVGQGAGKRQSKEAIAVEPLAVVNYQAMGNMCAGLFFNIGIMAFGSDWAPDEANGEHLAMAAGFRDYLKSIEAKDIPPGFALVALVTAYTVKRATKPTVKAKFAAIGLWFKDNLRIFSKRKGY